VRSVSARLGRSASVVVKATGGAEDAALSADASCHRARPGDGVLRFEASSMGASVVEAPHTNEPGARRQQFRLPRRAKRHENLRYEVAKLFSGPAFAASSREIRVSSSCRYVRYATLSSYGFSSPL